MECRDLINSINHVAGNQKITTHQFEDRDIIAYAEEGNDAVCTGVFLLEMVSLSVVNIFILQLSREIPAKIFLQVS